MADGYLTGNRIIGLKKETTPGTYNAPLAADFNIEFFELAPAEWDYHFNRQGKPASGNLAQAQSKSGMISAGFTGKTLLEYTGDQAVSPAQAKLWEACGLVESGVGTQTVYTYDGTAPCSALSALVTDLNCGAAPSGIDKKIRGVQADVVFNFPDVGQEITCDYTFAGAYEDEVDNASSIKVLTGVDTGGAEKLLDRVFTFGGNTYRLYSGSLALGNTVSMRKDPNATGGIFKYGVTGTDCKLTAVVEKIDVATSGLNQDVIDDTVFNPINLTTANGHWDFAITDANLVARKDGDAEGYVTEELEFEVRAFTLTQKD